MRPYLALVMLFAACAAPEAYRSEGRSSEDWGMFDTLGVAVEALAPGFEREAEWLGRMLVWRLESEKLFERVTRVSTGTLSGADLLVRAMVTDVRRSGYLVVTAEVELFEGSTGRRLGSMTVTRRSSAKLSGPRGEHRAPGQVAMRIAERTLEEILKRRPARKPARPAHPLAPKRGRTEAFP